MTGPTCISYTVTVCIRLEACIHGSLLRNICLFYYISLIACNFAVELITLIQVPYLPVYATHFCSPQNCSLKSPCIFETEGE